MNVEPAYIDDLSRIQEAYAEGRRRQQECGTLVWPEFSDATLIEEVRARKLFRVVDNGAMAGTFAIAYEDRVVWGDRERGAHVYLHRIARGPSDGSRGLLHYVVDWACAHSRELQREGIRMDTAAASSQLVAYYEKAGFVVVGRNVIKPDPTLPTHYHGTEVALFEMSWDRSACRYGVNATRSEGGLSSIQDVTLRETRITELDAILAMEEGDARDFIIPYSLERHHEEFAKNSVRYLSIDVGGKLSGFVILALDDDRQSVEFRRIVIARSGHSFGSAALKLIDTYSTETLRRNRIWLDVFKTNARARHVYEKHGFTQFGQTVHDNRTLVLYELYVGRPSDSHEQKPRCGASGR